MLYRGMNMSFQNPSLIEGIIIDMGHKVLNGPEYRKYVESLHLQGDESLLDFGCGSGIMSRLFAQTLRKGKLTCLEKSPFWLTRARKRLKGFDNVDFLLGSIDEHDLPEWSFDIISINFVLHDIKKSERQGTIDSLAKKLKNSGRLIIREPTKESHGMQPGEIDDIMEAAGLKKLLSKSMKAALMPPSYFGVYQK